MSEARAAGVSPLLIVDLPLWRLETPRFPRS
jgi:hypothetical protein